MSQTYPSRYYDTIDLVLARHFWFAARNRMLSSFITKFLVPPTTFLEVGCGTGIVLKLLEALGYVVTGLDVNKKALDHARPRTGAQLIHRSLYSYTTTQLFGAVGAFDVLEHQRDDRLFLRRLRRLLTSGGYLFLTVPAGKMLWSKLDVAAGHKKRYEPDELVALVQSAGFQVLAWRSWGVLTLPLFRLWRSTIKSRNGVASISAYLRPPPGPVNLFLDTLLRIEERLPFVEKWEGASLVLCARLRSGV